MASYFLYNKKLSIDEKAIKNYFANLGVNILNVFTLGNYRLLLFKKALIDIDNFYQEDDFSIFVTGSIVYKKKGYLDSKIELLRDFRNKKIILSELYGNYSIIFYNHQSNQISLLNDPLFLKNVYIDYSANIISNNFISIIEARPYHYNLNYLSLIESTSTGSLIPPDTYAEGVERLCKLNVKSIPNHFESMDVLELEVDVAKRPNSRKEAIEYSSNSILEYFEAMKTIDLEFGSHIGLTGGFDSRLLLLGAHKTLSNINTNSFYRGTLDREYVIAKDLAKVADLDFVTYEDSDYNTGEFIDPNLALSFIDGQVRSQNYIDEPYSHPNYGIGLYKNHLVGFHGCGGEQYRNADRMNGKISFDKYIKNEWILKNNIDFFEKKSIKNDVFENVKLKIRKTLDFYDKNINLLVLKKIQNEIWNPSNRLTRVNALNQQQFYFAPFTEWQLSLYSYKLVDYLGKSNDFQVDMMLEFDSKLNEVPTTYGYSIKEGRSKSVRLAENLIPLVPRNTALKFYRLYKNRKNKKKTFSIEVSENSKLLNEYFSIQKMNKNRDLAGTMFTMNNLLKNLKVKF